ncbi:MAG: glycosyltransferase family 39 protein, partial [Blastocatellia bacterium]|nr:glycosyltransferase family 39 protein [Blastocatellia bacterium]
MPSPPIAEELSPAGMGRTNERSRDIFFLLILLAGFTIGAFVLGYMEREPDADERVTLEAVSQPVRIMAQRADLLYPPLYFVLLKIWVGILGLSLFSLRIYSLIFGILAVYLVYRCGAEMFSPREGLWAALLLTLSNFHLYYATEARMYSMIEAGSVILTLSFFRAFIWHEGRTRWEFAAVVAFLGLTHYFAWFFIFGQGLYLFLHLRKKSEATTRWWIWVTRVLPFGVLSLILLVIVHRAYPQAWGNL